MCKQPAHLILILLIAGSIVVGAQPLSWTSHGIGGGGSLYAPSINPGNNSEFYVGCDMSEQFHTTDYGLSYSQLPFQQFIGGAYSKMCFTATSGLLYSMSSNLISGNWNPVKSTDNGLHWTMLPGPDTTQTCYSLDVDYNNPQRMVVSNYGQIYFSNDGGNTFTSIHTAVVSADGNTVGGVFFDGNNIYIGTNDGVLVSTTAGASWTIPTITGLGTGEKIYSFCAARTATTTRFFCLTSGTGNWNPGSSLSAATGGSYNGFTLGAYVCNYGSGNWVSSLTGINLSNDFPLFLGMAGNDITTAYMGGGSSAGTPVILKTSDGGSTWTHALQTGNNQNIQTGWCGQGGDHGWTFPEVAFGLAVAPNNSSKVLFSDFSDVHKTSDGGTTWQQAYLSAPDQHPAGSPTPTKQTYHSINLENTSCWQVLWINANNIFSGFTDICGVRSTDGGNGWSFNYTGNTANTTYRTAKGNNGVLYAGTSNIHDMYASTHLTDARLDGADANGKLIYSADSGKTWITMHSFGHPVCWVTLDPNNAGRAYASVVNHAGSGAAGGVYRCDNLSSLGSSTWTLLPTPPRTEGHPSCLVVLNDGKLVATFSGRYNSGFTASSGCFVYDPVANTWADVSDPSMHYWTKDIVVDPNDASQNTWYVGVFCGWGGPPNNLGGLYKTTNRGVSWTLLTNLNNTHNVTSCTFTPGNANQLYMTTEYEGLWVSSNINAPSPVFSQVTSYPFKQPERVFFNPYNSNEMWIASFGNGMKSGLLIPTGIVDFSNKENRIRVFPNPSDGQIQIQTTDISQGKILHIFNLTGQDIYNQKIDQGNTVLNLGFLPKGVYLLRLDEQCIRLILQ
ncbi:MAG: T9SS type A sorting domain-containing protein [Bacteroidia bacterium]